MPKEKLYIQMFSIHGLIRGENPELGRDADTGGQVTYALELVKNLCRRDDVCRVNLFTRLIDDPSVSSDYARPVEEIDDKCRIIRIQCGGKKYMRKELLWPHLDEYIDKTIKFIKQDRLPDIVHGHYPDAGYVAMELARIFGIPFVFTGHSLGRPKKQKLLNDGMTEKEIVKTYRMDTRIATEERIIRNADLIVTSTRQEISDQYGMYHNAAFPEYRVIPPGIDLDRFYPYYHDRLPEFEKSELEKYAQASLLNQLERFLMYPDKPLILAICRPDKRKNISGLIQAYGEDRELQALANLAVFAGIRKDIDDMEGNEKQVLTQMLLDMDRYDLYGKLAIPKKHDVASEVPELYRIAAGKRGVFVNVAWTEPFGLTLLEAAATGLPLVATNDGGPQDIIENCKNGILVDPVDHRAITHAIKNILTDENLWGRYSKNGIMNVRKFYTWEQHAAAYMKAAAPLTDEKGAAGIRFEDSKPVGKRLVNIDRFLITDIDNTLIGKDSSGLAPLLSMVADHHQNLGFGVSTGRSIDSATKILAENGIDPPDVIVSSVGTEIYYGRDLEFDKGWETHIADRWDREKVCDLLKRFGFLEYQEAAAQRRFKVSYNIEPGKDRITAIHDCLVKNKCRYTLVYSHEQFVDILPYRASKGKAIRYLSYKWSVPLSAFLVCGDSGNDEEMLRGEPRGVVVGNFSPELEKLKGAKYVYFAGKPCAAGILEGIAHYRFLESRGSAADTHRK